MIISALEQAIQTEGRLAIGSLSDVRLWRNNVGELSDSRGIPVKFGLAVGSGDTLGIVAPHGRWLSIEWKRPGYKPSGEKQVKREREQQWWRDTINAFGGIALRCDSVEQGLFAVVLARDPLAALGEGTTFPRDMTASPDWDRSWRALCADWDARKPKPKEKRR